MDISSMQIARTKEYLAFCWSHPIHKCVSQEDCNSPFEKKAKMLPVTFVIKARKM